MFDFTMDALVLLDARIELAAALELEMMIRVDFALLLTADLTAAAPALEMDSCSFALARDDDR